MCYDRGVVRPGLVVRPTAKERSSRYPRPAQLEFRARADSPRDFCFVMVWRDLAALRAFVGDDIDSPHVDPAEAALVESRVIRHYDLVTE